MGRPARAGALPGLGAVGTLRERRGVETMETTMSEKIRRPTQSKTPAAAKAKTVTGRPNAVPTLSREGKCPGGR